MDNRFETFTVLINRISRNIRKIKNREMADLGLRSAHVSCLYYLSMTDGLTATDLCEKCEEDKATISRAVDFLETEGYLTCHTKAAKRYKSHLQLTPKGKSAGERIADRIDGVLEAVGLDEEDRQGFYRDLGAISDRLEKLAGRKEGI